VGAYGGCEATAGSALRCHRPRVCNRVDIPKDRKARDGKASIPEGCERVCSGARCRHRDATEHPGVGRVAQAQAPPAAVDGEAEDGVHTRGTEQVPRVNDEITC